MAHSVQIQMLKALKCLKTIQPLFYLLFCALSQKFSSKLTVCFIWPAVVMTSIRESESQSERLSRVRVILMCSDGVHQFHQDHLSPLASNSQMTLLCVSLKLADSTHTEGGCV